MGDINPLARKTLDMQDLYPCIEDIASFFSSNRKMRKSANCWTVALTGLICLTWHHSPNTFHLRFVNPRWGSSLRYSEPLGNRFRKSSLLVESFDNLQGWRLRFQRCRWKWCEQVCLSSFCTGGRIIGKSIGRSNRSGNHSWFGQTGAIRTISTCSDLV